MFGAYLAQLDERGVIKATVGVVDKKKAASLIKLSPKEEKWIVLTPPAPARVRSKKSMSKKQRKRAASSF